MSAGWGWPGLSKKAHWFREGSNESVCGRWLYLGERNGSLESTSPDDCTQCWKKLLKLEWGKNDATTDGRFAIATEKEWMGDHWVTWAMLWMPSADYKVYESMGSAADDLHQHGSGAKAKLRKLAQEIATKRGYVANPGLAVPR